jgi:uncharacterized protein
VSYLFDVNVLIALLWPPHEGHARVQRWFAQNARHGWATCAMTQAGFVRIVSNPQFSRQVVSPLDALQVLEGSVQHASHQFWTEDIGVSMALAQFGSRLVGHRQITDAYLLALAIHKKGRLVTLDGGVSSLLPARNAEKILVVL